MSISIDWGRLEEVVERAVRRARAEELKDVAEAIKTLAEYVKKGFEIIEEHSKRIEEHSKRIEEYSKIIAEHSKKIEEHSKRIEELSRRIEEMNKVLMEHSRRIEELTKAVQEQGKILAEHSKILAEHSRRLEELTKEVRDLRRTVTVIAHRFGVLAEEGFREAMKHVIEEIFGVAKVEKWVYNDVEGIVYGVPAVVEADLLIRDKEHILLEIKSRVSRGDVIELHNIGELYKRVTGIKPRLVIVGGFIDKGVEELAKRYGVEIIPITQF
jgi:hypothetical protein